MPVLRVLDVSHTSIKTLPSSISKLFRLRELFLRGCEMLMELPPEIGRLTNLKVLDLEGTELGCLPKQVGGLRQLERLKFSLYRYADSQLESISGNERSIIPRETLSKLSCLKELSIGVNPECEWWDAEMEAIVNDLGKLGKLETLKLYFTTVELFQQLLQLRRSKRLQWDILERRIYPTLSNFRLIVGRHGDSIMSCVPRDLQDEFLKLEKCLKYVNGMGEMDAIITKALEHVGALFLDCHWVIDTLSVFDMGKMDKLKFCLIAECNEMKTILGGRYGNGKTIQDSGAEPILGSLRYLGIHYMKNLRSILEGPIVTGSLSSLNILAIHTCPELSTIFNLSLLDNLIFLQELIVEDCPKIQSLVTQESSLLQHKEFLLRLKKISLLHLPELHNISSGLWIAPRLEKMVVYDCPKLKNLHPLERCSKDIQEIKGETEWWESNKSDWGSDQHDYLVRVFVPLEDDDSNDELAEAVRVSLIMSQCGTKGNNSSLCASGTGSNEPSGLSTGCGSDEIMLVGAREKKEPMRKSASINYLGHEHQLSTDESVNTGSGGYTSANNAVHHHLGVNQKRKQGEVAFQSYSSSEIVEDGFLWRKYGQKDILGEQYPRSYYRCVRRNECSCLATKQVQRSSNDPRVFHITYRGIHNHWPNKAPNQMVAEPDSKAMNTDYIDYQRLNYLGVEGKMDDIDDQRRNYLGVEGDHEPDYLEFEGDHGPPLTFGKPLPIYGVAVSGDAEKKMK